MNEVVRASARYLVSKSTRLLPIERQKRIERYLRGWEEHGNLASADYAIVSYGKSGRTWLRVMLSRFYQRAYGLPDDQMLGFANFKRRNPAVPSIFFTHGNYLRDFTAHWDERADFYATPVVLLVRDPRDIAVSQYFQWKYRMTARKKLLNDYPPHGSDTSIFEFVADEACGLPAILEWLAIWQREIGQVERSLVIRYEDMRVDPGRALARTLDFLQTPATPNQVEDAVAYASYENMKKLEEGQVYKLSGTRLMPGERGNPQSYKTRRGKVGGYRDYFTPEQLRALDEITARTPLPDFGYDMRVAA